MKSSIFITLFCFVIFCHLGSMAMAAQQKGEPNSVNKQIVCTDPRPQVCTMDYRPVCGQLEDGSFKIYSNGCTACSVQAVIGYVEGECKK